MGSMLDEKNFKVTGRIDNCIKTLTEEAMKGTVTWNKNLTVTFREAITVTWRENRGDGESAKLRHTLNKTVLTSSHLPQLIDVDQDGWHDINELG